MINLDITGSPRDCGTQVRDAIRESDLSGRALTHLDTALERLMFVNDKVNPMHLILTVDQSNGFDLHFQVTSA